MNINIEIIGTIGEGKTAICYMLKEFMEGLTNYSKIEINDDGAIKEFDETQWKKYKDRFSKCFINRELNVNIKTIAVKKEGIS